MTDKSRQLDPYTNCFFLFSLPGSGFPSSNLVNLIITTGFSPCSALLVCPSLPLRHGSAHGQNTRCVHDILIYHHPTSLPHHARPTQNPTQGSSPPLTKHSRVSRRRVGAAMRVGCTRPTLLSSPGGFCCRCPRCSGSSTETASVLRYVPPDHRLTVPHRVLVLVVARSLLATELAQRRSQRRRARGCTVSRLWHINR